MFGQPMRRKRLYIVLVREELMIEKAKHGFDGFCQEICQLLQMDEYDTEWHLGFFT